MLEKSRDISTDVWRGIAICMVLLLHAYALTPGLIDKPSGYAPFFHNLGFGVNLFFVLSGYLISESFDRSQTVTEFFVKRIAKIVPLYLIFLHLGILTFVIAVNFVPETRFFRNGITWDNLTLSNYLSHLFFLQGFSPAHINSLNDGSWSIVSEVYFYALFPLIRMVIRNLSSAIIFCVTAVLLQGYFADDVYAFASRTGNPGYLQYYFLGTLPNFALGLCLYWVRKEGLNNISFIAKITGMAGVFLAFVLFQKKLVLDHTIFLIAAFPLIATFKFTRNFATNTLASFGRQTYALYFIHIYLTVWAYNLFESERNHSTIAYFSINLLICFPASFAVSYFLFNRIDKYCLSRILEYYKNRITHKMRGINNAEAKPMIRELQKLEPGTFGRHE